jgi:hypothetical protein
MTDEEVEAIVEKAIQESRAEQRAREKSSPTQSFTSPPSFAAFQARGL